MSADNPIKAMRLSRGLTQTAMAAELDCSLRTMATLETLDAGDPRVTKWVTKYLRRAGQSRTSGSGEHESDRYSWDQGIYDLLLKSRQLPNRADRVSVLVDLRPSKTLPESFASIGMTVTFENLITGDSSGGLLIDAVGNPDGPGKKEAELTVTLGYPKTATEGSDQPSFIRLPGLVFERLPAEYPHVICYQLSQVDPKQAPRIELHYTSEFATRIDDNAPDAMGFPVPADLMLGEIDVCVRFHRNLCPSELPASTHPFPIRRYARAARPKLFTSEDVPPAELTEDSDLKVRTCRFRLLRPKPGYGYVISWTGLHYVPIEPNSSAVSKENRPSRAKKRS